MTLSSLVARPLSVSPCDRLPVCACPSAGPRTSVQESASNYLHVEISWLAHVLARRRGSAAGVYGEGRVPAAAVTAEEGCDGAMEGGGKV